MAYYFNYGLDREFYTLVRKNDKKVNFFLDLLAICSGFYNRKTIYLEIQEFIQNGRFTDYLFHELANFIERTNKLLKDPFFVIFYDGLSEKGRCLQNIVYPMYKRSLRSSQNPFSEAALLEQIKKYYFVKLLELEKFENVKVFYLKQYESDFLPHYMICKNYYESASDQILNAILSVDKDLLQTLKFPNTVMCTCTYRRGDRVLGIYNRENAFAYLLGSPSSLTAEYIPLVLSIAGDRSDNIPGVKGYGIKKAVDFVIRYRIPPLLEEIKRKRGVMPSLIQENFETVERNYHLISFEEQIRRLPSHFEQDILKG